MSTTTHHTSTAPSPSAANASAKALPSASAQAAATQAATHAATHAASAVAMPNVKRAAVSVLDMGVFAAILAAALYYLYIKLWKNRGLCSKGSCSSCPSACKPPPRRP